MREVTLQVCFYLFTSQFKPVKCFKALSTKDPIAFFPFVTSDEEEHPSACCISVACYFRLATCWGIVCTLLSYALTMFKIAPILTNISS